MKFTGTRSQLFQAIEDGGQRFQCIGQSGLPKISRAGVAGLIAAGAGVTITRKLGEKRQDKRIRRLVKREVAKAVKARQPKGLAFDFFG
ncbi:MAG: hypothetical protein ABS95_01785 [Verrucomicrobia bacterium SCN 57-15]|nr:MAG: hypothetical protein ABS95_01785 [Verrucomicrobia bacterium SCN 57-15]